MATSVYVLKKNLSKSSNSSITTHQKGTKIVRILSSEPVLLIHTELQLVLTGFGFCIPDNPYDQVAVRIGQIQPEMHRKLHNGIPSHWQSETWDPQESVFYLRVMSQNTSSYNTCGVPKLSCLRRLPPELVKSVYIIMLEHSEGAVSSNEEANEKKVWVGTIDVLLHQMEYTLKGITRWDGELPDFPSTARAKAALIYRTGQIKILEEVILDMKTCMDPLRAGEIGIEDLFKE